MFQISDRISVLRDGKYLGSFDTGKVTPKEIVALIAGKELEQMLSHREDGKEILRENIALEVRNMSRGKYFNGISFKLYKGEMLGFYGLQGSGRTELLETIFGLYKPDSGEVYASGRRMTINNSYDAIRSGFALVTEDRRRAGLFCNMDVKDNVAVVHKRRITFVSFLIKSKIIQMARKFIKKLDVKLTGLSQMVVKLSGDIQDTPGFEKQ